MFWINCFPAFTRDWFVKDTLGSEDASITSPNDLTSQSVPYHLKDLEETLEKPMKVIVGIALVIGFIVAMSAADDTAGDESRVDKPKDITPVLA